MPRPSLNVLQLKDWHSNYNNLHYHRDTNQDTTTSSFYEFSSSFPAWNQSVGNNQHGIELKDEGSGVTGVYTNTGGNIYDPLNVGLGSGAGSSSVTFTTNDINSDLVFYDTSGNVLAKHTITAGTLWTSASGPTVTSIDIYVPPTGPYNPGIGPSYYLDGEIISNDTILASDVTLYKDGVSYPNSNITMYGNSFQLTKSGNALYRIECGGKFNVIPFVDRTWVTQLTASSSTRTTNVVRIKEVLATIALNQIPANAKMYIRTRSGAAWSSWIDLMSTSNPFYEQNVNNANTNYRRNPGPGYYLTYYHSDGVGFRYFKFDLNEHLIDGNYEICGWFRSYYYSGISGASSWHEDNEEDPQEIGAGSVITSYIYSNDSSESRSSCVYDPHYLPNASGLEEYQLKVDDWVYEDEPEGDAYVAPVVTTSKKVFTNFW